jgi:hypothetical protein
VVINWIGAKFGFQNKEVINWVGAKFGFQNEKELEGKYRTSFGF